MLRFTLRILGRELLSLDWDEVPAAMEGRIKVYDPVGPCAECEAPRTLECLWCHDPLCRDHAKHHCCPEMISEGGIVSSDEGELT